MLQRYKLRLGDGTILLVDRDGLETWLVDRQATVQGPNSNFIPLRKFLAMVKAAEAHRARREADARDGIGADEVSGKENGPPLTPPPSREKPTVTSPMPPPREDGLPLVPPPPPPPVAAAPEPAPTALPPDEPAPVITPPETDLPSDPSPIVPSPLAGASEEEVSLVIPGPEESETAPPDPGPGPGDEAPPAPEAVVPAPVAAAREEEETDVDLSSLGREPPPAVAPSTEREAPAPVAVATSEATPPPVIIPNESDEEVRVTVGPARVMQVVEDPSPVESPAPVEPPPAFAPAAQVPPREPQVAALESPGEPASWVPPGEPQGVQALAEGPSGRDVVEDVTDLPVVPLKDLPDEQPETKGAWEPGPAFEPEPDDEPARARVASAIRKPLAGLPNPLAGLDLSEKLGEDFWKRGRAASVQQGLASVGSFFSRCLAPINRLEKGQPLFPQGTSRPPSDRRASPRAEKPGLGDGPAPLSALGVERLPVIPLKPVGESVGRMTVGAGRRIRALAGEWFAKPAAWAAARRARKRSETTPSAAPLPPLEPSPPPAPLPSPAPTPPPAFSSPPTFSPPEAPPSTPIPHRPVASLPLVEPPRPPLAARPSAWRSEVDEASTPPPRFEQLRVLPLATPVEPASTEDVYDFDGGAIAGTIWLWTKRLVVTAALAGGGAWAFMNFDIWSPPAAEIGQTTLTEIDGRVRTLDLIRQRHEAVAAVQGELPHLSLETIRQLMALSPIGLLDAKGVFEAAWIAAERGTPRLPADEALELEAVQNQLLGALFETEREWLREYDKARFRGAVFPFDAQQAHKVYARGVRRLPEASRETLRLRLNQAIVLGIEPRKAELGTAD